MIKHCILTSLLCYQLTAQCVVNLNQPGPLLSAGTPVAWPKPYVLAAPKFPGYISYIVPDTGVICYSTSDCRIPPLITAADYQSMDNAFANWMQSDFNNNSSANFIYGGENAPANPSACSSDPDSGYPPCPGRLEAWLSFGKVPDVFMNGDDAYTISGWGNFGWGSDPDRPPYLPPVYYRVQIAYVFYSDAITNPHYVTHVFAHEIGHTLALDDCEGCDVYGTVMTTHSIVRNDIGIGLVGPSSCDNAQVFATDVARLFIPSKLFVGPEPFQEAVLKSLTSSDIFNQVKSTQLENLHSKRSSFTPGSSR